GHLDLDAVRDSFTRGRELFARAFPEYGPITLAGCNSWLLDPQFGELLPDSNIARFGRIWEPEDSGPGDGEVLFFVFDVLRGLGDRLHEIRSRLTARTGCRRWCCSTGTRGALPYPPRVPLDCLASQVSLDSS